MTAVRLPTLPWAAGESGPRWDLRRCATCAGSLLRVVGRARFTVAYLGVLLWTTVLQRHLSAAQARSLLAASSTDVWHLTHRPLLVLIESALWLPGARWWPYAILFLLFMVPLERSVGIRRLFLIFVSGHVLATLLTELPLAVGIALGWFPSLWIRASRLWGMWWPSLWVLSLGAGCGPGPAKPPTAHRCQQGFGCWR
jgi:hypothetical protein